MQRLALHDIMPLALGIAAIMLVISFVIMFVLLDTQEKLATTVSGPNPRHQDGQISSIADAATSEQEAASEERAAAMREQYAVLEQSRKDLQGRLNRLIATLWNVHLPPQQANQMAEDMGRAYALLQHRPLLGAFHDLAAIKRQQDRVNNGLDTVKQIEEFLASDINTQ